MTRWCPRCGAEYVSGWDTCSECGTPLETASGQDERAGGFTAEDAIFIEPRAAREHSDPFVPVWEGPYTEAAALLERLSDAAIPSDLDEALDVGRSRVMVPRSYVAEVEGILDHEGIELLVSRPRQPQDWEPFADQTWPAWVRVAIWVIALVVIFGLVWTARF